MSIFKKTLDNVVNKAQTSSALMKLDSTFKVKENNILQVIQQLRQQRDYIFAKIGQKSFEMHQSGSFQESELEEYFSLLYDNKDKIAAQEALIAEVRKEYEKEVSMLRGSASQQTNVCPQCGVGYTEGIEVFCSMCGFDLRTVKVEGPRCPKCNTTHGPEDVFCHNCGFNLKEGQ